MLLFIIVGIIIYIQIQNYKKSSYYKVTNNSVLEVVLDKGKLGEYLTYKNLIQYEEMGAKFLFNLYISKENDKTTELDLIMITKKGILVFESKNQIAPLIQTASANRCRSIFFRRKPLFGRFITQQIHPQCTMLQLITNRSQQSVFVFRFIYNTHLHSLPFLYPSASQKRLF